MSDNALVKIGQQELQQGGQGIDFGSKLFRLKPSTLSINQRMTQAEGAIPGRFRIIETGDQFEEMTVALLVMPAEARKYEEGDFTQGNRAMLCYSRDMKKPDPRAKIPQALSCSSCPRADWTAWRNKFDSTGQNDLTLIPPCSPYYYAVFIDTVYQLPLQMYIRGGENRSNFEDGTEAIARKLRLLAAEAQKQGRALPNLFDLQFVIKAVPGKKKTNYVLKIDPKSIKLISDEDKALFGDIYLQYVNQGRSSEEELAEEAVEEQVQKVTQSIDAQVVTPGSETAVVDGEISF